MSPESPLGAAAVPELVRIDPHGPGLTRARDRDGFRYRDPSGAEITQAEALGRIRSLRIPPAWADVWISPEPLGHIQATGVDSRGRTQYLYHQLWREQRDVQKFAHMLRFARALPELRAAALSDLKARGLRRERVVAGAVRLIDLGLFRVGGEKYAELDHHYGATTLLKQHVKMMRGGMMFDYIAKAGKHRTITISDQRYSRPCGRWRAGQRPGAAVLLRERRRLARPAPASGERATSPPGRAATSRPRSSVPGMRPC